MASVFAFHNSFEESFRKPFGALMCSCNAELSIFVCGAKRVCLRLWVNDHEVILEGEEKSSVFNDMQGSLYTFTVVAPEHPCLIWYYFLIYADNQTLTYSGNGGVGAFVDYPKDTYQITVYKPFETSVRFRNSIAYQIFPDRFKRGGKRGGLDRISAHTNLGRQVYIHENWDDEVLYSPLPGEKHYAPCDFFGGDLYGIIEELPYLESLGVGCIYMNPIFESPSNHRYDTSDYMHTDAILGGDMAVEALSRECASRGIRIMLDGVFSHTGADSIYFNKNNRYNSVGAYNSPDSQYSDWYKFESFPETYSSWWGFKNLPEVDENCPKYRDFIKKVLARWTEIGITYWRLDVADELPDDFIRMLRDELKRANNDAVLIGEVWEDASNKHSMGARRGYVNGDELDGVMNYPFRNAVIDFLLGNIDAKGLNRLFMIQRENYPRPFYDSALNILGSHDTVRILTVLGGAPGRDELTRDEQAKYELSIEQLELAKKRLRLAASIQFSMPGVPCIYYGDERGALGMADPFSRRTMDWQRCDKSIFETYRLLAYTRRHFTPFISGITAFCAVSDDVFAIVRQSLEGSGIIIINRSMASQSVRINAASFTEGPETSGIMILDKYSDIFSGKTIVSRRNTKEQNIVGEATVEIEVELPPLDCMVLIGINTEKAVK